ncbi:MAG: CoA-transferase subunit beta [Halobacteriales archaeon]
MSHDYTERELMIACGARELNDGEVGLIGVGLPLLAAKLAKQTHAPTLERYVEIGLGDPQPVEDVLGIGDVRIFHHPVISNSESGVMLGILQRGDIDVGFLGGIQVDQYGNLNTTLLGDEENPERVYGGSGGANDIASCAGRFHTILPLEERRFPERVDYLTSPGYLGGGDERAEAGLPGGGPDKVITDRAVFDFEPDTKRMRLHSVHPGETVEGVRNRVGFDLVVPDDPPETPPPTDEELSILRDLKD